MTEFMRLWDLSAFRASFNSLAELDVEEIRGLLRKAWDDDADDSAYTRETRRLRPVIETLVSIRRRSGLRALTTDLDRLVGARSGRVIRALEDELPDSPDEVDARTIQVAQHGMLPVLDELQIDIDFRMTSPEAETGEPGTAEVLALVPVLVVRLSFDEPVGGHDAIVFQVPDDMIPEISRIISRVDQLRSDTLRRIPEGLVPKSVRSRLVGE